MDRPRRLQPDVQRRSAKQFQVQHGPAVYVLTLHAAGIAGLIGVVLIGTLRPINIGVLALVATMAIGTLAGEPAADWLKGFPVDLLVLLTGVTYLFGVAVANGTVAWIVDESVRVTRSRRQLIPWVVFALAAAPAMAGALGSTGVALLAPLAMRVAERCALDRRMMGLMVVHGAAAGNFSPLNVLGALAKHSVESRGLTLDPWTLFVANLAANLILAAIIVLIFRRPQAFVQSQPEAQPAARATGLRGPGIEGMCTIGAFILVAGISLGFGLSLGLVAFGAGAALQLAFPKSTTGAERHIAWGVVLLVCGVVTYVAALQRYGTVSMAGAAIAAMGTPALVALLLCAVGAVTSAFASSAGILGAMLPLAAPFMLQGTIETTAFVTALALSVTLVDAAPFSTVGALAVASADSSERTLVYRGLLAWGGAMIVAVPIVTWLIFVLPSL